MTAISTDTQRPSLGNDDAVPYPVKDDEIIYAGALTCLDSSGLLVDATNTAGLSVAGVAREGLDNTNGGNGTAVGTSLVNCVEVFSGRPYLFKCNGSPVAGAPVYVVDNNTVTTVAGHVPVGVLVRPDVDGGDGLWYVQIQGVAEGGGGGGVAAVVAPLTGTLTGTANSALVDVAATAAATAGGSTPTAAQVDTGIATAVASIVTGVNEQNKEFQTTINAILTALKNAGIMAS